MALIKPLGIIFSMAAGRSIYAAPCVIESKIYMASFESFDDVYCYHAVFEHRIGLIRLRACLRWHKASSKHSTLARRVARAHASASTRRDVTRRAVLPAPNRGDPSSSANQGWQGLGGGCRGRWETKACASSSGGSGHSQKTSGAHAEQGRWYLWPEYCLNHFATCG